MISGIVELGLYRERISEKRRTCLHLFGYNPDLALLFKILSKQTTRLSFHTSGTMTWEASFISEVGYRFEIVY